jgi:hypothetical protein
MGKLKFEPGYWITFVLNGQECIGRTLLQKGQEMVAVVVEDGNLGYIPFIELTNPLRFDLHQETEEDLDSDKFRLLPFTYWGIC